jgi:hypothetical protein
MASSSLLIHVSLDVRACRLCIVHVEDEQTVVCAEYALRSQDAALELFAYLDKNRGRFASVRIA